MQSGLCLFTFQWQNCSLFGGNIQTDFFKALEWLKDDKEDIFDSGYSDILRISYMYKFGRGKMKDLVSLLGGRNFETKEYNVEIAEQSFKLLKEGVLDFMNRYSHLNFILAIKSIGIKSKKLINSDITLDFAYTLYLLLSKGQNYDAKTVDRFVQKWYVLSTLTSRYINSPESKMDEDLRNIKAKGFEAFFKEVEAAELSETFWQIGLVQRLETSGINSPYFNIFLAAQICGNDNALFSRGTKINDLISILGDVHHIFPKKYLTANGIKNKSEYNQIANYTYLDTQVNKDISDDAPCDYFSKAIAACQSGESAYGNINNYEELLENLRQNCIPIEIASMTHIDYREFLQRRRELMADKIHNYYDSI